MAAITVSGSLEGVGVLTTTTVVGTSHMAGSLVGAGVLSRDDFYNTSFVTIINMDSPRDATDFAQLARKNITHTVGDIITAVNKFGTMQRYTAYAETQASPQRIAALWDTIDSGNKNYYG